MIIFQCAEPEAKLRCFCQRGEWGYRHPSQHPQYQRTSHLSLGGSQPLTGLPAAWPSLATSGGDSRPQLDLSWTRAATQECLPHPSLTTTVQQEGVGGCWGAGGAPVLVEARLEALPGRLGRAVEHDAAVLQHDARVEGLAHLRRAGGARPLVAARRTPQQKAGRERGARVDGTVVDGTGGHMG